MELGFGEASEAPVRAAARVSGVRDLDGNVMTTRAPLGSERGMLVALSRGVVSRVSWAVVDQSLFALANFAGNLVLARWLTPVEYGSYVSASAVFWLAASAHTGLLSEPTMVFGSGRFRDCLSTYFATLAVFHWYISAMVSAGLAVIGLAMMFWGSPVSGWSMMGYALAAPMVLLLWLLRRTVYLWSHPRLAAGAGGVYLVGMLAILYALYRTATLSPFTAPLAAAGAGAVAIAVIMVMRGFPLWSRQRDDFMRLIAAEHWRYGRWAVVSGVLMWIPGSLYYLIVPIMVGLEANGALNALWVLVMPATQLTLALTFLLIPAFSRVSQVRSAAPLMWVSLLVLVAGASLYALLIALFGGPLMDLMYRERYTQYAGYAWLMGLIVLPVAAIAVFGSALRARERPDCVLWAYVISTAVTCAFGVAAVAAWGVLGAILGLLAGYMTTMLAMLWWVLRTGSQPKSLGTPKLFM
jgi:O-antigen/teichoic acid export membrane protein